MKKTTAKKKRVPKLEPHQLAALLVAKATGSPRPKGITAEQEAEYERRASRVKKPPKP